MLGRRQHVQDHHGHRAITAGIPVAAAATEPTAQEAIQSKSVDVMQGYIVGVGEGLSWANAHLIALKQPLIYCQPSQLGMIGYQYIPILEKLLEQEQEHGIERIPRGDGPVASVKGYVPV
jgi:hypothetical protein